MRQARAIVERAAGWLDFAVVLGLLATVSLVPVRFMVPFNDEWLRMNYLADHSVWEWTVMHIETWVVRPTGEVILGLLAAPLTRPALEHDFRPEVLLARFHAGYVILAVSYWLLLAVNAAIVARGKCVLALTTLLFFGGLVAWATSIELAFAFYWADGYANVMIPFTLFTCGLPLLLREHVWALALGTVFVLLAVLGHEVMTIYALGCLSVAIGFRRPQLQPAWRVRAAWGALWIVCLAILYWQLFGKGAMIRNDHYFHTVGKRYDFASAWLNIREIDPIRATAATLAGLLAVGIYKDRLTDLCTRAREDAQRHRWFWILLVVGTLVTSFLPLGTVGLKKGRLAVSYYSVLAHLFFVLSGALAHPLLARVLDRALAGYARVLGSVLPVGVLVVLVSPNLPDFRDTVVRRAELRSEAESYMRALFEAKNRVMVCRPRHPYSKPGRKMTDRNQQDYFKLEWVRNRCPK